MSVDFAELARRGNGMVPVVFVDGADGMATGPQRDGTLAVQKGAYTTFRPLEDFDIEGSILIERKAA